MDRELEKKISSLHERVQGFYAKLNSLFQMAVEEKAGKAEFEAIADCERQISVISERLTALQQRLADVLDFLSTFQAFCTEVFNGSSSMEPVVIVDADSNSDSDADIEFDVLVDLNDIEFDDDDFDYESSDYDGDASSSQTSI